ncbi:MAG: hypothetical protein ACLS3M_00360 [Collinsella sp.]
MTKKNKQASDAILHSVIESLVALEACEKTGEKRKRLNGKLQERVLATEAYAAISDDGRGYVLIEPFGRETSIVHNAGSAPVTHALRHAGLDWIWRKSVMMMTSRYSCYMTRMFHMPSI